LMTSIERQVCDIVTSVLEVRPDDVRPDSTWDDYKADSLDIVELVFALEQHFGISFEIPELETIKSVADMVRMIERKIEVG
jgi:acyl carrier protein